MPAITNTDRGRAGLRAWLTHVSEVYERHGAVIRTWTEAELAGDSVARQGDHVLTGVDGGAHPPGAGAPAIGAGPHGRTLAVMMMVERFHYYAATGQVDASRDELLDTLTDVIMAAIFS
jgi:hypothetical protein